MVLVLLLVERVITKIFANTLLLVKHDSMGFLLKKDSDKQLYLDIATYKIC